MSFWEGFIQNVALGLTMEYRVHWNWQARINFFFTEEGWGCFTLTSSENNFFSAETKSQTV